MHALVLHDSTPSLGYRYGRAMQTVSGVHYNFSLPDGIWPLLNVCGDNLQDQRSNGYLAPIRNFGSPVQDTFATKDYVAEQRAFDSSDPRANGTYLKSGFIEEVSDGLVDALVDGFSAVPERSATVFFQCSGGAIGRVPADATAFPHRFSRASVFTTADWPAGSPRDSHVQYVRDHWAAMEPFTRGFYVNEIANESQQVVNANYEGNYSRLVDIKNKYDPSNLFRLNANIQPTV